MRAIVERGKPGEREIGREEEFMRERLSCKTRV